MSLFPSASLRNGSQVAPHKVQSSKYGTGPGSAESPIQDKLKEDHTEAMLIKLTKIKDKEKILKATRKKQQITYNGT